MEIHSVSRQRRKCSSQNVSYPHFVFGFCRHRCVCRWAVDFQLWLGQWQKVDKCRPIEWWLQPWRSDLSNLSIDSGKYFPMFFIWFSIAWHILIITSTPSSSAYCSAPLDIDILYCTLIDSGLLVFFSGF